MALDVDPDRAGAGVAQTTEPGEVDGRLYLYLDRQPRHRLAHGVGAAREVARPTMDAVRCPGRHDELADAVHPHRGRHDLGELLGLLDAGRLAGAQRRLDRAEATARLLVGVAHTRLNDGRREDMAPVQLRDLLVRHAVLRDEVVEARTGDGRQIGVDDDAVAREHPAVERRPRGVAGHRQRHRPAIEQPVPVVARPGARAAPHRRRRPQAANGQLRAQAEVQRENGRHLEHLLISELRLDRHGRAPSGRGSRRMVRPLGRRRYGRRGARWAGRSGPHVAGVVSDVTNARATTPPGGGP